MYSIYPREPEEFSGKIILVVGTEGSGAEIVTHCIVSITFVVGGDG